MPRDFISGAISSITDAASDMNPLARNIDKKDKRIIEILIANAVKTKEINRFVDVYKSDVEAYVDVCKEAAKLARAMAKPQGDMAAPKQAAE